MTAPVAVVESETQPAAALVVAPKRSALLRPVAEPSEIIEAQNATRELIAKALVADRDYGTIPGVNKPSLLKPGAERVALAFGCGFTFTVVEKEVDHDREVKWVKRKKKWNNAFKGDKSFTWEEDSGVALGLYRYVVQCDVVNRATGDVVGSCLGSCSTLEAKYADRPRDCENTVLKMAEKRAMVGAVLTTFGLSEQFTQDVEEMSGFNNEVTGYEGGGKTGAEPAVVLTRDSVVPFGKAKGTAVKDLDEDYLKWGAESLRGVANVVQWKDIFRAELAARANTRNDEHKAHDATRETERHAALTDDKDDLPF